MGQFKVQQLLNDTIITLCQNAMKYDVDLQIDGLIGITVDKKEVVLVKINEFFENPKHIEAVTVTEPERPVPEISSSPRKRKRRRSSTQSYTSDNVPETIDRAPHPGVPSGQDNNLSDDNMECVIVKQEHNDTVHSEMSHGHWDHRRSFVDEPGCSAWDGSYGNSTHNQKQSPLDLSFDKSESNNSLHTTPLANEDTYPGTTQRLWRKGNHGNTSPPPIKRSLSMDTISMFRNRSTGEYSLNIDGALQQVENNIQSSANGSDSHNDGGIYIAKLPEETPDFETASPQMKAFIEMGHAPCKFPALTNVMNNKIRTPRKRCRVCYTMGKRKDSSWFCAGCPEKPGLCFDHFAVYHVKKFGDRYQFKPFGDNVTLVDVTQTYSTTEDSNASDTAT